MRFATHHNNITLTILINIIGLSYAFNILPITVKFNICNRNFAQPPTSKAVAIHHRKKQDTSSLSLGFFDDLMKNWDDSSSSNKDENEKNKASTASNTNDVKKDDEDIGFDETDFRKELEKRQNMEVEIQQEEEIEYDGYMFRDAIYNKWGECFDVEFQPVNTFGFRDLYLNIMPFRLGSKRFRHRTELDYLCHLQAVVEILVKYNQLDYILAQIDETKKKPRAGTSPLVAVPLRLDLTEDQLDKILRNM